MCDVDVTAESQTDTVSASRVKPLAILATVDLRPKPQPADTGTDDTPQPGQVSSVVLACHKRLFVSRYLSVDKKVKKVKVLFMDWKPITKLRSVTCHMGSHSVTCHPTQVNVPHLNPSHAGRYPIYLPWRDGMLS